MAYVGAPYVKGSSTSKAAAVAVVPKLSRLRRIVLDAIIASGHYGCTDDDLEQTTGLPHQTVSARRKDLVDMLLVEDSGRQRSTQHNALATVWIRSSSPGRNLPKPPPKPTLAEARLALEELRDLYRSTGRAASPAVVKTMEWFKWKVAR